MQTIELPRALLPVLIAKLRELAERHGVRRAAQAVRISRHLFLVAVAGLPLDAEQRATVEAGIRTVGDAGAA